MLRQLDSILHSSSGQIATREVRELRKKVAGDRKSQLTEDEAVACVTHLVKQGWIRENPNEAGAAPAGGAAARRADGAQPNLCLGERSYAELRAYVEEQTKGRKCASCQQPCLLVSRKDNAAPAKAVHLSSLTCVCFF